MKTSDKYILTEAIKISQQSLRKKFDFLPPNIMNTLVMDIWHYIDPRTADSGSIVFSYERTFEIELIKRLSIKSYNEYLMDNDKDLNKIIKSIDLSTALKEFKFLISTFVPIFKEMFASTRI